MGIPRRSVRQDGCGADASAHRPLDRSGRARAAAIVSVLLGTFLSPLLTTAVPEVAHAAVTTCTHNWVGPAGGSFMVASNWDARTVPGRTSKACAPVGSSIVFSGSDRIDSATLLGSLTITAGSTLKIQPKPASTLSTINNLTISGRFHNTGPVNLTGTGTIAGVLTGSQDKVITAGSTYTIVPGGSVGTKSAKGSLRNAGTLTWASGNFTVCRSSTFTNQGLFNVSSAGGSILTNCNNGTATFKNDTAGTMNVSVPGSTVTIASTVMNAGTINVTGGTLQATGFSQTAGVLDLSSGAFLKPTGGTATFTGGTLRGTGTVMGNVSGTATVSPGGSAIGTLSVNGTWTPAATSSLAITLAGTAAGSFDQLAVTNATLGGTLALTTAPGFTPVLGQSFTIMTGTGITGAFATVTGSNPAPGLYYVVIPSATSVVVEVHDRPGLTIADVSVVEGDTGNTTATFGVTLSAAFTQTVTVAYATSPGTATAGTDYTSASGTLTFTAGQTSKLVNITVKPDTVIEPNETFNVTLSTATNADIIKAVGLGTIIDDDTLPSIFIDDTAAPEGTDFPGTLTFTARLSNPTQKIVKVPFATADGTALATSDYTATTGTLTFASTVTSQTFTVTTTADDELEPDETMLVNLGVPTNGVIGDGQAVGTIQNDDAGFTLTTTADTTDVSPGDSRCADLNGLCSLRAAISEANVLPDEQEIRLADSATYTLGIAGTAEDLNATGDLDVLDDLTITGNNAIIDGGKLDRVLHVPAAAGVTMTDTTIRNGLVTPVNALQEATAGGGILLHAGTSSFDNVSFLGNVSDAGGGLTNVFATLTMTGCTFTGNLANLAGGGMFDFIGPLQMSGTDFGANQTGLMGGGLIVWGYASVSQSTFHDNKAYGFGGAIAVISKIGFTVLDNISVTTNIAPVAAGIVNGGVVYLTNSKVDSNTATDSGAGVGNAGYGTMTIVSSTISNNTAANNGGGIENRATLVVKTSTVSGNHSLAGLGSGITSGKGDFVPPVTTVIDSTITNGTGASAVEDDLGSTTTLANTIVGGQASGVSCTGVVASAGFNLLADSTCNAAAAGDVQGVAPNLGPLADNGGLTLTHLPNAGSAAIGTGLPTCSGVDQRGTARPSGGACDKGAVEQ